MGDFFKKLFDFGNVKKLFTYNWGDVFKYLVPKSGHTITVNEDEFNNVQNGSILMAAGSVVSGVLAAIVSLLVTAAARSFFGGGLVTGVIITSILTAVILALIVPGFIFIYNRVTKDKQKGTVVYFIIWILAALSAISLIFSLINWIGNLITAPIYAIFGLASLFLEFMGIVHLLVGTIDICNRANKENADAPAATPAATPKFCPKCGAPVDGGKFCSKCGNQF